FEVLFYLIFECRTASCFSAFSPGSLPGDFFRAVRSPEKGQKRGGPLKISRPRSRFIPLKLLKPEINRIFVR
uniref:hypothetical protein n=1 Tax=Alistipes shahii TaxID=328814 RepID=UPI003FF0DF5E